MTQSPGRPRNPEIDTVILNTTLILLGDRGYSGLHINDVATKSGVAKATIYRRWPTLAHLTVAAMEQALGPRRLDSMDDLIDTCTAILGSDNTSLIAIALDIHRQNDPQLHTIYRERIIDPVRQHAIELIKASDYAGDPINLADAIIGGLIYRAAILSEPMSTEAARVFILDLLGQS